MRKDCGNGGTQLPTTAADVRMRNTNSDILQNSYMFMKNIRGTVAYFRNALYNLLAMFRSLGPPTLFMTLSADDLHWPELGMLLENLSYEAAVKKKSFFQSMRSDPLMTAIHFDRRFSALMKFIVHGNLKPLGVVKDYFARAEFQLRGSPHYHIFFWCEGVPTKVDGGTRDSILQYISNTIHTHIPLESDDSELYQLVKKLQTHHHGNYCTRSSRKQCRFGFPKRDCPKTKLLSRIMAVKNRGQFYETYRPKDSVYVNSYNPEILRHWRANMDIQLINDADGAAYYVCHYLCKAEPDELKCALSNLINTVFQQNPEMTAFQRLWNIGLCVLKNRQVSAQEAAFRLSNLKLIQCSRSVVFLNTRPQAKRFKMLKPLNEIESMDDAETDIFLHNIIDYYSARPSSMETMSLHYFASWYKKCPPPVRQSARSLERLYVEKYNIWIRKRKSSVVIRFPSFSISNDDYYFTLLMLLLPFRSENEIVGDFSTAKEAFKAKHSFLDFSVQMHNFFLLQVENSIRRIRLAEAELEEQCEFEGTSISIDIGLNSSQSSAHLFVNNSLSTDDVETLHYQQMSASCMSADEFTQSISTLTNCQKRALQIVQQHSLNGDKPLRLFITGGAGVGKSHLLKIIVGYLQLYTARISGTSPVKCCSPTGTAARHIYGQTIHSLLHIPVDKYLNYASLTAYSLNALRKRFVGVHTIVLDELSMVSDRMFTFISRRLGEIAGNTLPFGNFNLILFGDFFQIKPVCGAFAFQNQILWDLFQPVFLRENVRQSGDLSYGKLLNRARVGMLSSDDVKALKGRLVSRETSSSNSMAGLSIYPKRSAVAEHNQHCQQNIQSRLFRLDAEHYFSSSDPQAGLTCPVEFIPDDDRDAGNIPCLLELSIGSRVMLLRNLDVPRGLVNGAMGYVHAIDINSSGRVEHVQVLFDQLFINSDTSVNLPVAIAALEQGFVYAGRSIIRKNFPLSLSWACTIHKIQGATTKSCSVDLGSSVFESGMAYVALSRVTHFMHACVKNRIIRPIKKRMYLGCQMFNISV